MKKLVVSLFVVGIIAFSTHLCFADIIYVDQYGGGDYKTIQAGINAAYADDTVKVGPGVYYENVVVDKDLSLIGSGPNFTTIDASQDAISVYANHRVNISAFNLTGGRRGINLDYDNVTCNIRNCVIVGCGEAGIICDYEDNPNMTIVNNTIVLNGGSGVYLYEGGGTSTANIIGNIIASNGGYGIYLRSINYKDIAYNDVFDNDSGNYYGCSAGTGDISQNPRFVDPGGNFVLGPDSPCIDTGRPGVSYNDPDGSRNDMGAYSGPDSVSFWPYIEGGPVITELQVTPTSAPQGSKITIRAKGRVR